MAPPELQKRLTATELLQPIYSLSKYIRVLFVVYILVSLLYTIAHFYFLVRGGGGVGRNDLRRLKIVVDSPASKNDGWSKFTSAGDSYDVLEDVSNDLLYSKLFQHALKPTKIIPYFYRAQRPESQDITITSMITIERLPVLVRLAERYNGPISVTLHLNHDSELVQSIEELHKLRKENAFVAKHVDLHLVIDKYDRQFNMWRNIARLFARSDYLMNLDVDFYLCTDLRANIDRLPSEYKAMLASGKVAFVVPAFEFTKSAVELEAENYPSKKDELLKYAEKQELVMFHNQWKRGHGPTDYNKWYSADKPYKVVDYNYNYEPYVLTKRENVPWCDERFVGYGSNKAACLYEIFLAGIEFYVLPNDFLIHQRHPYPENDRRIERKYNKRLYDAFREEACFRYSRMSLGQANETFIDERICGKSFPSHFNL